MEDTAMEVQWYKNMDESMNPWNQRQMHGPGTGTIIPDHFKRYYGTKDADVLSSSTIPTAREAASSSISIPNATAAAASSSTTAKACSPKVGAKGSCASPANARPGDAHDYSLVKKRVNYEPFLAPLTWQLWTAPGQKSPKCTKQ